MLLSSSSQADSKQAFRSPAFESETPVVCAHCGLPVLGEVFDPGKSPQFCCAGCSAAYAMICEAGLSHYYSLKAETETAPARQPKLSLRSDSDYRDYDTPAFVQRYTEAISSDVRSVELYLEGVHCAACLWLVEKLPSLMQGVLEARLDFERQVLEVRYRPREVGLANIASQLAKLGYPPRPYNDACARGASRREERRLLTKLGVAGAVAGNVMLLSFALYSGAFADMSPEFLALFEGVSLIVSLPALSYCALEFYRGALSSLRTRTPHMDLPVSLGILTGALWGVYSVLSGRGEPYFDTVTALIFLLLVGRYLERLQLNRARYAMERAQLLTPARARLVSEGAAPKEVLVETVCPGDVVLVKSGETLPVDGVVKSGSAELDNRMLTGESRPLAVSAGSLVFAGATNLGGVLEVVSQKPGSETRVARLMREVERARRRRAPVVRMADRIAGKFVMVVLALAAVTLYVWLPRGIEPAVEHTIALLIVACPCALGLATPLAFSAALGRAAERRLLVKGGDVLETLRRPGLMVFDKTGTLTTGQLSLVAWEGDRSLQPLVSELESFSSHPVALALCRDLPRASGLSWQDRREVPGGGVQASAAGRQLLVGAPAWVQKQASFPEWARLSIEEHTKLGHTPVAVALDGGLAALAFLDDTLANDAAESLRRLKHAGYDLVVLSGDHELVTETVARRLAEASGVPDLFEAVIGGATPEAKLAFVEAHKARRPLIVVGDGVNDAAALAAADVGIAVKGGAEASLLAADVYLGEPGLRHLVTLIDGARRTFATIRRGITLSLVYNVVGVSLAMAGWVGPLLAAILMPLSSLSVVTNAYRARTFRRVA